MIDFHCHLDLYPKPDEVIARASKAGIYVLSVTTTPKAFPGTKRLAAGQKRIRTALGLHPQLAHERHTELGLFDLMLPETNYVGEIGLDGSAPFKKHMNIQTRVFRHILNSCQAADGRTLSIHSRGAAGRVLDALEEFPGSGLAILHWFSGSMKELERAVAIGCWFSVGPAMTSSAAGRERVESMPQDRVLLETDGPFAMQGGKSMEPIHASRAIGVLADAWNFSIPETKNQLRSNLKNLGTRPQSFCQE